MRDQDPDRVNQEGPGGLPAQGEQGGAPRDDPTEESPGPGARADLVAGTVEASQARLEERDRDALRGTIDPSSPLAPGGVEVEPAP